MRPTPPHEDEPVDPRRPTAPLSGRPGVGEPPSRRRWRRAATVTGSLVVLSFAGQAGSGAPRAAAAALEGVSSNAGEARVGAEDVARLPDGAIASIDGVVLINPSTAATVVGFHEAAGPAPLPLTPAYLFDDHNAARGKPSPTGDPGQGDDLPLIVLPTRDRAASATTAIDVASPDGHPIVSPVSGTVLSVERFILYGQHEDHVIMIAPDGRPDLAVKLVHVTDPAVTVGEQVEAGATTVAGSAKLFPFSSQIDRFTDEAGHGVGPHVHIEVERAAAG